MHVDSCQPRCTTPIQSTGPRPPHQLRGDGLGQHRLARGLVPRLLRWVGAPYDGIVGGIAACQVHPIDQGALHKVLGGGDATGYAGEDPPLGQRLQEVVDEGLDGGLEGVVLQQNSRAIDKRQVQGIAQRQEVLRGPRGGGGVGRMGSRWVGWGW